MRDLAAQAKVLDEGVDVNLQAWVDEGVDVNLPGMGAICLFAGTHLSLSVRLLVCLSACSLSLSLPHLPPPHLPHEAETESGLNGTQATGGD